MTPALGALIHRDEKILARPIRRPHQVVVDALHESVHVLVAQLALDDQHAVDHAGAEVQVDPTKG